MPATSEIPPPELLRVLIQADRLLEARILPDALQDQLQEWTLRTIKTLLERIEAREQGEEYIPRRE
jgi:hypothetical protein